MKGPSPDDIAARYFAGLDALSPLRAIDLRMIVAELCSHCRGGPSTRRIGRFVRSRLDPEQQLAEWQEVCSSCGRDWEPEPWGERCVLRGEIQVNARAGSAEEHVVVALDRRLRTWPWIVQCMEPRPRRWTRGAWGEALAFWRAHLRAGSCELVAEAARLHGVEAGCDRVERVLRHARAIVAERMLRRGDMKEFNQGEILAEIARLETKAEGATNLDRIAIGVVIERLRKWVDKNRRSECGA